MKDTRVAIIGCGNLGLAIVKGLIDERSYDSSNITATKRNVDTIKSLEDHGVNITNDNVHAVNESEVIIVAVKPYKILGVLEALKDHLDPNRHILVSVATGITINEIKETVGHKIPVFRAMPNTAADVKESVTCICSDKAGEKDTKTVRYFFDMIGSSIMINEDLMESATVLGACGIAYVLRFIRAMIQGGIQIGFDANTAGAIVNQVVRGASGLLIERKEHPEFEIDKVTTPRGCTIVGLNEMEHNGFSSSLIKGIVASFDKIDQ